MKRQTEAELFKSDALEIARTAINLKYRLAAKRERNTALPDLEDQIDNAILGGETLSISPADLFEAALGDDTNEDS